MDMKKLFWFTGGGALAVLILVISVFLILKPGQTEAQRKGAQPKDAKGTQTAEENKKDTSQPSKAIDGQSFSGKGGDSSKSFKVDGGLTIVKFTHDGVRNFVVQFGQGENPQLLVNVIGKFAGSRAFVLTAGSYDMTVRATGPWTIEVTQPRPTVAPSPPLDFKDKGPEATAFFKLKAGKVNFDMASTGNGIFAPYLIKADGQPVALLATEIEKFQDRKEVTVPEDGIYLIDVTAEQGWSIHVDQ
jgi:hypothetical protein